MTNQPTESPTLLPCPFCGSTNITFTNSVEQAQGYYSWSNVECDDCEACSGDFKFEEALEHWNRRDGVAAALQAERERALEEAAQLIESTEFYNSDENAQAKAIRALAQKGGG